MKDNIFSKMTQSHAIYNFLKGYILYYCSVCSHKVHALVAQKCNYVNAREIMHVNLQDSNI